MQTLNNWLTVKQNLVLYWLAALFSSKHYQKKGGLFLMTKAKLNIAFSVGFAFCCWFASTASFAAELPRFEQAASQPAVVEETIGRRSFQVSRLLVKARPDQVWQILTDYNNASFVFPCLKKCRLLNEKGSLKIVEHEIQPTGLFKSFKYILEIKETGHRQLEWHRLSGDFREVQGFWKLDPVEGGRNTLVTYATYVNGGIFLPQVLVKRQFRTDMPLVLKALKSHVESSTQIASRRIENSRTP